MAIITYSVSRDGVSKLSPHFSVNEFRPKWNGVPDGDIVKISQELIQKLELLSDCVNNTSIRVNDGYRTEAFDRYLTGATGQHALGLAADISVKGYSTEQLCAIAEACGFTSIGYINSRGLHVDVRQRAKVCCFVEHGTKKGTETIKKSFLEGVDGIYIQRIPLDKVVSVAFPKIESTVKEYATTKGRNGVVATGGFYKSVKVPQYWHITNGIVEAQAKDHKWGIGFTAKGKLEYGTPQTKFFTEFVSGHPVLLDNGKICPMDYAKTIREPQARTLFGMDNDTLYIVAIEKSMGMTLNACAQIMLHLGAKYAVNLSGCNGVALFEDGKAITNSLVPVNNAIHVVTK